MITQSQRKKIDISTDNIIAGTMKGVAIHQLNRRIAYWRYKRIHSKKYGYTWRRCNRAIALVRREINEVLDPMWCKK